MPKPKSTSRGLSKVESARKNLISSLPTNYGMIAQREMRRKRMKVWSVSLIYKVAGGSRHNEDVLDILLSIAIKNDARSKKLKASLEAKAKVLSNSKNN